MSSLVLFRVPAVANCGRWIVRCFRCKNAEDAAPNVFLCTRCGARAEIEWPPAEMVYGIERLLLMRPDEMNQNWEPGETLVDLMVENGAHGIFTPLSDDSSHLIVEPERIRVDTLPATFRRELRAVGR